MRALLTEIKNNEQRENKKNSRTIRRSRMIRASPLEPEVYGACAGGNGNGTGNGNGNELYTTVAYRTSSYGNKELLKSGSGRSSKHLRLGLAGPPLRVRVSRRVGRFCGVTP